MPSGLHFALYPTALGVCGIAWRDGAVVRAQLPEISADRTRARMLAGLEDAIESEPEGVATEAASGVNALFAGEAAPQLDALSLDWAGVPELTRRVLEACRAIPHGETRTYGDLARGLGDVALSQAVGQALGSNPFAPIVPCHRVLGSGGKVGGFSAGQGLKLKLAILNVERAKTPDGPSLFDHLPLATRDI